MKRTLLGACLMGMAVSALPQRAEALPPPVVTSSSITEITPNARFYTPAEGPPYGACPQATATQQDTLTLFGSYTYVTFYDQDDHLCLARKNGSGPWVTITFDEIVADVDTHRTPNVGISRNDGRVHLSWGHFLDVNMRYKYTPAANSATVADGSWNKALFSAERDYLNPAEVLPTHSYPMFVTRESDKKLFMFWRTLQGASGWGRDSYVATYNDNGTWSTKRQIIDGNTGGSYTDLTGSISVPSASRNAYYNDVISFNNELRITWCWRESPGTQLDGRPANRDSNFAKSSDGGVTWQNNAGTPLTLPINQASPVRVNELDFNWDVMNQNGSFVDKDGKTHVVLTHRETDDNVSARRYWHYVQDASTPWPRTLITDGGTAIAYSTRPKVFINRTTNTVYMAAQMSGKIKVFAAQQINQDGTKINWTDWNQIYETPNGITYSSEVNGRMDLYGNLILVAQRKNVSTNPYSRLDRIRLDLDADGP